MKGTGNMKNEEKIKLVTNLWKGQRDLTVMTSYIYFYFAERGQPGIQDWMMHEEC